MSNEIVFLRHAETSRDAKVPTSSWSLSPESYKQTKKIRATLGTYDFDYVISSSEKKAYETASSFEDIITSTIIRNPSFNELNRDDGPYLSDEEYLKAVQSVMNDPTLSFHGWETVESAMNRFNRGVDELNKQYQSKKLLVVSHGIVLTMFFASLLNYLDEAFDRWRKLRFCSYGIVKNEAVVKDIVG
jgi:broad specificity phosphatase PhoE